ncbi:hypothetical protein SLEP1_g16063 [Rubroshorea leprosula]|uniref:BZIP domain-containing protein n=1 Tax=Rubroshorea leprosula TaxID=152421 RepID=A0AAV5ITN6_9ROSI|nr:hypothetical protein SLEP1_g16063 [Rubroshorea leprosula]
MEESGINQSQGNQTAAATQLLATATGDPDSQRDIGEDSDEARRDKKRKNDKRYRDKQRDKRQALEGENDRLKQEIQEKDKQEQLMKSKLEVVEAENARLKCELEEKKQLTKSLLDVIGVVNQQQISTTDMQPLLTQIKLVVDGFVSLNRTVAELQQTVTQHAQPWRPQRNILINQCSQPAATTLPLTQPAGTSRMQQTSQSSPATFTENFHGLPDFLLQEQLGQTAQTINVSPEFGLPQGQGGNTAVESQPFTQGPSDQDADLDEFFSSFYEPEDQTFHVEFCSYNASIVEGKGRKGALVRGQKSSTKQTILSAFIKAFRMLAASLVAENDPLKPEIQKKQEPCHEDQQMKSNIEAFEAENKSLKREIKEKERRMKLNLKAFLVDYRIVKNQIEAKGIKIWEFVYKNARVEHEIKEKERLMKSNMEAFEAKNGQLKLEIGEKEQKSNLKAFKAQNKRLKRKIEENKQRMKSNLKALEAKKGKLEHEIQAKEQLMKSNLERLDAQIRQLVDEFESLNVANVMETNPVNTARESAS